MIETLGERIKQLRKDKSFTQQHVGSILNVTAQAISRWEKNETNPDLDMIVRIAELFDVSVEYIITGKNKADNEQTDTSQKNSYEKIIRLNEYGVLIEDNDFYKRKLYGIKNAKINALYRNLFFYIIFTIITYLFLIASILENPAEDVFVYVMVNLYFATLVPFFYFKNKEILLKKIINNDYYKSNDFFMSIFWCFVALFLSALLFTYYLLKFKSSLKKLNTEEKSLEIKINKENLNENFR